MTLAGGRSRSPRRTPARAALEAPEAVRLAIIAHARRDYPNECCGFLVGSNGRVLDVVPMPNTRRSPTRYRIDDAAHIALRRSLRAMQPPREIVGVYHSHPDSAAEPSATDIAEAHYPEWFYVIAGTVGTNPEVRAYAIANGRVSPLTWRRRPQDA